MEYNLSPEQRAEYTAILTENPYRWAGDSITLIIQIVEKGSHEPSRDEDDPDFTVASNRNFLLNEIALFEELGLNYPEDFVTTIALADAFLREATPAK